MKRAPLAVTALVSTLIVVAVVAAGGATATTTKLTATIAAQPGISGVFLASLSGRALGWRLSVHGVRGTVTAQLRLTRSGPVTATLCRACKPSARGTTQLSSAAASALARRGAYISVQPLQSSPAVWARIVLGAPTLEIVSPKDGQTITLPAQIVYRVTSFQVGPALLGHLEATAADGTAPLAISLPSQSGTALIPDTKKWLLGGPRDIAFTLATADRTLLPNPEARVVVHDLTIAGRR